MIAVALWQAAMNGAAGAETGDLNRRLLMNFDRLEQPDYRAQTILAEIDKTDWPGDFPGRTILAWTALAEATGRPPQQLKALVDGLPAKFNAKGYLGKIQDPAAIDEQQLSGHAWLISGLCRYSAWSGDKRPLAWVRNMIQGLALPLRGKYAQYPRTPDSRNKRGAASGTLTGEVAGGWKTSTDIGCAFILLEGLVAADRVIPSPELEQVIKEAADSFLAMDLRAVKAQTHSSLSAARNLLLYETSHGMRQGWLPKIEAIYQIYREQAMSENEANWNWFERPDSWTEPCAVVDSFVLALGLWHATGQARYLNDAHCIFYNGLGYGQKPHGGFGCDTIAGQDGLMIGNKIWDVTWCCNMRGAVGLASAAAARAAVQGDTLLFPFYATGRFKAGGWEIREQTGWPYSGKIKLELRHMAGTPKSLVKAGLFVPAGTTPDRVKILLNGREARGEWQDSFVIISLPDQDASTLELRMEIPLRIEKTHNVNTKGNLVTLRHGYLLLGAPEDQKLPSLRAQDLKPLGDGRYQVTGTEVVLRPLCDMPFSKADKDHPGREQMLFQLK